MLVSTPAEKIMTLVEFMHPLKKSTRMRQLLAALYYLTLHEGVQSVTVEDWFKALKQSRLQKWDKKRIADTLRTCGPYIDVIDRNASIKRWRLTETGLRYVEKEIPGLPASHFSANAHTQVTPASPLNSVTLMAPVHSVRKNSGVTSVGMRPRVFIGSSNEGRDVAEAIQQGLDQIADCIIWTQGVFAPSMNRMEALEAEKSKADFAVLVLTPDDVRTKRGKTGSVPRDNVIFELGLFIGALGRERTFMVSGLDGPIELPSDLAGFDPTKYRQYSDENLLAALGSACTTLKQAIKRLGHKRRIAA